VPADALRQLPYWPVCVLEVVVVVVVSGIDCNGIYVSCAVVAYTAVQSANQQCFIHHSASRSAADAQENWAVLVVVVIAQVLTVQR
jgi:hypothetical protein